MIVQVQIRMAAQGIATLGASCTSEMFDLTASANQNGRSRHCDFFRIFLTTVAADGCKSEWPLKALRLSREMQWCVDPGFFVQIRMAAQGIATYFPRKHVRHFLQILQVQIRMAAQGIATLHPKVDKAEKLERCANQNGRSRRCDVSMRLRTALASGECIQNRRSR